MGMVVVFAATVRVEGRLDLPLRAFPSGDQPAACQPKSRARAITPKGT